MNTQRPTILETLDDLEIRTGVNIEQHDESGEMRLYTYTDDGDCLSWQFDTMDPVFYDVRQIAESLCTLRVIADRRPRVGKLGVE